MAETPLKLSADSFKIHLKYILTSPSTQHSENGKLDTKNGELVYTSDVDVFNTLILTKNKTRVENNIHYLNINDNDPDGYTPLCYAAANNISPEIIVALINEYGLKPSKFCIKGKSPIQLACEAMNLQMVKALVGEEIPYIPLDSDGKELSYSIASDSNDEFSTLDIPAIAKIRISSKDRYIPRMRDVFTAANLAKGGDLLKILLDNNSDLNLNESDSSEEKNTPLMLVCKAQCYDSADHILSYTTPPTYKEECFNISYDKDDSGILEKLVDKYHPNDEIYTKLFGLAFDSNFEADYLARMLMAKLHYNDLASKLDIAYHHKYDDTKSTKLCKFINSKPPYDTDDPKPFNTLYSSVSLAYNNFQSYHDRENLLQTLINNLCSNILAFILNNSSNSTIKIATINYLINHHVSGLISSYLVYSDYGTKYCKDLVEALISTDNILKSGDISSIASFTYDWLLACVRDNYHNVSGIISEYIDKNNAGVAKFLINSHVTPLSSSDLRKADIISDTYQALADNYTFYSTNEFIDNNCKNTLRLMYEDNKLSLTDLHSINSSSHSSTIIDSILSSPSVEITLNTLSYFVENSLSGFYKLFVYNNYYSILNKSEILLYIDNIILYNSFIADAMHQRYSHLPDLIKFISANCYDGIITSLYQNNKFNGSDLVYINNSTNERLLNIVYNYYDSSSDTLSKLITNQCYNLINNLYLNNRLSSFNIEAIRTAVIHGTLDIDKLNPGLQPVIW